MDMKKKCYYTTFFCILFIFSCKTDKTNKTDKTDKTNNK